MLTLCVTKHQHSILFHALQAEGPIDEYLAKWKEVKSLILGQSFEGRDALSIIQLVDEDYFDGENYIKREVIKEDTKYLILSATNWKRDTLNDMINYMEFDLAKQWFAERKAEENVPEAIKLVNDLQFTTETDTNLELLGCVSDGKEIVWLNPNPKYQSRVFEAFSSLSNVTVLFE